MNDFIENLKVDLKEIAKKIKIGYAKLVGRKVGADGRLLDTKPKATSYEINLVPEVKAQMIRAQKIRNIVLFVCILVASISAGTVVVLFGIKSGQDIAMSNQDRRMKQTSEKLMSFNELDDLVTIQGQLKQISSITDRKTVLSRVFGAVGVMLMQGSDSVKLSELRANLQTNVVNMEGQAEARVEPLIDYRVLEAFKKSVELTKYDYGRYVDIDGKEIPTQCIKESDEEGNALKSGDSYYAWWDLTIPGCKGTVRDLSQESAEIEYHYSNEAKVEVDEVERDTYKVRDCENDDDESTCVEKVYFRDDGSSVPEDAVFKTEEGDDGSKTSIVIVEAPARVMIWRTPQFKTWHKEGKMSLDGVITGVEHFNSVCYQYRGVQVNDDVRWNSTNDCFLAQDGLRIASSSNGRDDSNNLVLRFTASVTFAEEFFSFKNKHMIAIGPMGQNVTDSYVQIGSMFTQEARECDEDDKECLANNARSEGDKNGE